MQTMLRTTALQATSPWTRRASSARGRPAGFPGARSFLAMNVDGHTDLYWLQCIDDGTLAFLAVSPWEYFPDYEPEIGSAQPTGPRPRATRSGRCACTPSYATPS